MSKLRTYELQNPDSASVNIELTPSGGTVLSGVVTATTLKVGTGVTISSGVVTATSFSGDGSALTGIDATALKDSGDTIRVQANTSGAVVTGVLTATSFSGDGSALTGLASDAISEGNTSVEVVDTGGDGHITFDTEGTEAARFDSSGRLLIGDTSSAYSNVKLLVAGADNSNYIAMLNTSASDASNSRFSSLHFRGRQSGGEETSLANIAAMHEGSADDAKGNLKFFTNNGTQNNSLTEAMRLDSSQNLRFNSGYGSVSTAYGVRAWGNYVCVGGSPGDRGSGNFSSLQDLGTGDFRFYFTNNMPDANYCVVATAGSSDGSTILVGACPHYNELLTSRIRVITRNSSFTNTDAEWLNIAVIR